MNVILTPTHPRLLRSMLGLLASAALITTGASAGAAVTKEAAALTLRLSLDFPSPPAPVPVTISNATGAQLAQAVFDLVAANPNKLSVGKVAGEALKGAGSNALDAGAQIAAKFAGAFPFTSATKVYTQDLFAGDAIKTAGSGLLPNLTQVPDFVAGLYDSTGAAALAISVKATKGAAGAVIQGGASTLAAGTRAPYANTVIDPTTNIGKQLAPVIQDVVRGVAATVLDANIVAFTNSLINAPLNSKNLLKIIPGIVAGQPTDAGAITSAALSNGTYSGLGSKSPIVAGAAALAKSIGAVADIEQIEKVGAAIAAQIPLTTTQGTKQVPNIKLASATAIVTTLAKAIAAKPYASLQGGTKVGDLYVAPGASAVLVKNSEKADELGELAAYFISALSGSAELTAANAGKTITGILKAVVAGGKIATGKAGAAPTASDAAAYTTLLAEYVAGSVALTVNDALSTFSPAIKAAINSALNSPTFAKSIAGASNASVVSASIALGITGSTGGRFESGFDVATGALTDPETNTRNF